MAIKSVKEKNLTRDSFVAEVKEKEVSQQYPIWSLDNLKKLSNEQLMDRLEQVDSQSNLIKWRILWTLRQRFQSDKVFGQYLANLRNSSTHYIIASSPQTITKSIQAGRFCEKHKITSLEEVGLRPSSIYALSRPIYDDVADKVFSQVKKKNLSNVEVERLLEQAKAVLTIEQPQQSVGIDYGRDSIDHDVIGNTTNYVGIEPIFIDPTVSPTNNVDPEYRITEASVYENTQITNGENMKAESNHQRRMAILSTLTPLSPLKDETSSDEILAELAIIRSIYEGSLGLMEIKK